MTELDDGQNAEVIISKLQFRLKMALRFTDPQHDKAHWRVSAIELLPAEDREHFYDLLSAAKSLD